MRLAKWFVALAVVLVLCAECRANVPQVVYKEDPGYRQARVSAFVAPLLTLVALVGAAVWARRAPSLGARLAALAFGTLVFSCCGLSAVMPDTRFPDDEPDPHFARQMSFRRPGSPRPVTREEYAVAGVFASAAVSLGGLALVRMLTTQRPTDPPPPPEA